MKQLIRLSICISFLYGGQLFGQGISFQHDNWKSILAQAKSENKLIFMDAFTTWCGPCKAMAKDVFTNEKVAAVYNASLSMLRLIWKKVKDLSLPANTMSKPTRHFYSLMETVKYNTRH